MEFSVQLSFTHPQTGEIITESIAMLDKSNGKVEDLGLTLSRVQTDTESVATADRNVTD